MRILGYGLIGLAVVLGTAAALAVSWYLLVGGILDLADGRTVTSGIARIDEWNSQYAEEWGRTRVGLLKVFVLEPIALVLIALAARALVEAGRALVNRAPAPAPAIAATPVVAELAPIHEPATVAAAASAPAAPWTAAAGAGEPAASPFEPEPEPEPEREPEAEAEPACRSPCCRRSPSTWHPSPSPGPTDLEPVPAGGQSIGATIPLATMGADGGTIAVTLLDVLDPVGRASPDRPDRYVAVRLAVENDGSAQFDDMPTAGAFLIGDDGERYRTGAQKLEPALREIRLAAGERCEGYLSFKLPTGVSAAGFRFTPNLGLATDAGEWQLAGREVVSLTRSADGRRSSTRLPVPSASPREPST